MATVSNAPESTNEAALRHRTLELEAALEQANVEREKALETIKKLQGERDSLRRAHDAIKQELELLKRRIFVATAERLDTRQLKLEFSAKLVELNKLADTLDLPSFETAANSAQDALAPEGTSPKPTSGSGRRDGRKNRTRPPTGRRSVKDADLPEVRVEIPDPLFEQLVADGKAEKVGFETSYKLGFERGGLRRVAVARVKYRAVNSSNVVELETAAIPAEIIERCLVTPDVLARIAILKFCDGLPLYRIEQVFEREGFRLDRGSMSRWLETLGATFGATVIHAARKDAIDNAFCIATDATGFAIQPGPSDDGVRRPCRKGHYFVMLADRDHVFFEFKAKETSAEVRAMFHGFEGYVQADAKSVYDVLYRPPDSDDPDGDGCVRVEIGCWSHCRRKYWEAAFAKHPIAREALVRIQRIFELDAEYRKLPPAKTRELRQRHLRVHVEAFLEFAEAEYAKVKDQRGALRSALGYTVRQRDALCAFLDDGRLRLDNNLSENALRKVVIIRDSALFAGSDEHAESAGHILSLVASARLHGLEPLAYLRDLIRVLPFWPRDRHLELAPKYWAATRATLDARQLDETLGVIDVPALNDR